jgi:uncharacterized membrane protein YccC
MLSQSPIAKRLVHGLEHGLMSAVAGLAAYLPTQLIGIREGFWAAITAVAVVQTEYAAARTTARDQFTGAAIGGVIGLAVVLLTGERTLSYALAVLLSILICWLLDMSTAARLAGTTATIILLVPHNGSPQSIMIARVSEVAWGVSVAIATVWLATRLAGVRTGHRDGKP